jgi:hypothetical protein
MTNETDRQEIDEDAVFNQIVSEQEGGPSVEVTSSGSELLTEENQPDKGAQADGEDLPPKWMETIPEEAKETIAQLQSDNQRLSQSASSQIGRAKVMGEKLEKAQAQLKQLQVSGADMSDESIVDEEFAENFPELAQAMKKNQSQSLDFFQKQVSAIAEPIQTLVDGEQQVLHEAKQAEAEGAVLNVIPDAEKILSNPAFGGWLGSQPAGVQAMANSEDPSDAIYILNQFKAQSPDNAIAQKRTNQLNAMSGLPTGRGGGRNQALSADDEDVLFNQIVREMEA